MHDNRAHNRSRKPQHRRKEEHGRNSEDRSQPAAAEAQQQHNAGNQRHMQTRDGYDMGYSHNGHPVSRLIGKAAAVAGQQCAHKCLRITGKKPRDGIPHLLCRCRGKIFERYTLRLLHFRLAALKAKKRYVPRGIVKALPLPAAAGDVEHLCRQAQRVSGLKSGVLIQVQQHPAAVHFRQDAAAVFRRLRIIADSHRNAPALSAKRA